MWRAHSEALMTTFLFTFPAETSLAATTACPARLA
jgi:hypothetical protein